VSKVHDGYHKAANSIGFGGKIISYQLEKYIKLQ
jgi:hypothetical protein